MDKYVRSGFRIRDLLAITNMVLIVVVLILIYGDKSPDGVTKSDCIETVVIESINRVDGRLAEVSMSNGKIAKLNTNSNLTVGAEYCMKIRNEYWELK